MRILYLATTCRLLLTWKGSPLLCAAGLLGAVIAEVVAHRVGEPLGTPVPATAGTVVAAAECRPEEPLQPTRVVTFSLIRAGLFVFG